MKIGGVSCSIIFIDLGEIMRNDFKRVPPPAIHLGGSSAPSLSAVVDFRHPLQNPKGCITHPRHICIDHNLGLAHPNPRLIHHVLQDVARGWNTCGERGKGPSLCAARIRAHGVVASEHAGINSREEILVAGADRSNRSKAIRFCRDHWLGSCAKCLEVCDRSGIAFRCTCVVEIDQRNLWVFAQHGEDVGDTLRKDEIVVANNPNVVAPRPLCGFTEVPQHADVHCVAVRGEVATKCVAFYNGRSIVGGCIITHQQLHILSRLRIDLHPVSQAGIEPRRTVVCADANRKLWAGRELHGLYPHGLRRDHDISG